MKHRRQKQMEIFELKQLADLEDEYRRRCLCALADYKKWDHAHKNEQDQIEQIYRPLQKKILRRTAEETVRAYWIIRHDFRYLYQNYMARLSYQPANSH